MAGAAAASTGAAPTAEASQEAASSGDSEFGSPQPGTEFSPEQPMEGDLGGDDFDLGQTGTYFQSCMPQSMPLPGCMPECDAMVRMLCTCLLHTIYAVILWSGQV